MKNTKVLACVLSAAMIAGVFTGCTGAKVTNISTEDFEKACEKTLKFDEYEIDDLYGMDEDSIKDGVYITIDQDDIEEYGLDSYIDMYLEGLELDDIFEAEDIESAAFAGKMTGMDDIYDVEDPDDLEDLEIEGGYALQLTLADDDKAADIMEYIADMLDQLDIDAKKDLSKKEFYSGKTDGYLRCHIEIDKAVKSLLENDDFQDSLDENDDGEEIQEALEALTGDAVISVEVSGANILIVVAFNLNTEPETLQDFTKAFGITTDLTKLPHNGKVVDAVSDAVSEYIERAREAAEQVRRHNEEVQAVDDEINAILNGDDWDD